MSAGDEAADLARARNPPGTPAVENPPVAGEDRDELRRAQGIPVAANVSLLILLFVRLSLFSLFSFDVPCTVAMAANTRPAAVSCRTVQYCDTATVLLGAVLAIACKM
jgi:hypothetical protein